MKSNRDIGAELLQSVKELKAGKSARTYQVTVSAILEARASAGLSQSKFAELMGVSKRTLQEWEQGRRKPSGAANTLIQIAKRHPEVFGNLPPERA